MATDGRAEGGDELPIRKMLDDATAAWHCHVGNGDHYYRKDLFGDLSCHVRALVAEVARLTAALSAADAELDVLSQRACAAERAAEQYRGEVGRLLGTAAAVLHQLEHGEASEGDARDIAWCARTLRMAIGDKGGD